MLMRLQHKRPDGEVDTYFLKPGRKYHFGRGSACEIRILDLKLSRKHCLFEYQGKEWVVEDLGSTNGAKLNGQTLANTRSLTSGAVIEAGTTTLTVAGFVDPETAEESSVIDVEELPLPKTDEAVLAESTLVAGDWDPQAHDSLSSTGALQPRSGGTSSAPAAPAPRPALGLDETEVGNTTIAPSPMGAVTAPLTPRQTPPAPMPAIEAQNPIAPPPPPAARPGRVKPITIRVGRVDGDEQHPTMPEETAPAAPAPVERAEGPVKPVVIQSSPSASPGTDTQERTFYITVLGKRIGPLTRGDARDLKARELKGVLTLADLEKYPQG